jgi:hypothetical protein
LIALALTDQFGNMLRHQIVGELLRDLQAPRPFPSDPLRAFRLQRFYPLDHFHQSGIGDQHGRRLVTQQGVYHLPMFALRLPSIHGLNSPRMYFDTVFCTQDSEQRSKFTAPSAGMSATSIGAKTTSRSICACHQ